MVAGGSAASFRMHFGGGRGKRSEWTPDLVSDSESDFDSINVMRSAEHGKSNEIVLLRLSGRLKLMYLCISACVHMYLCICGSWHLAAR